MCESPYSALRYRVAEGIAHIVLDRPPLNLIDEVLTRIPRRTATRRSQYRLQGHHFVG
ncbi:MAG: hypothetical protein VXZ29_00935 [Pseudomonadota bacterium]|nr:hypothetical protein [Pseudomonadota bacterium]MEC8429901.1 hypothetical protein [Pseudomonadota bacterium]